MLVVFLLLALVQSAHFDLLKKIIDIQPVFDDICVSLGRNETEFAYCKGNVTMDTKYELASSSKVIGAMPFYERVQAGDVRMDDHVYQYLDYWTQDPNDTRSHVRLQDLVSFQSGFHFPDPLCLADSNTTLADCVRDVYENYKHVMPGLTWDYNEIHLQILGAVIESIEGKRIDVVLAESLIRYNMTHSTWEGGANPILAGSLTATATDYAEFLKRYFSYQLVNTGFRGMMESNYNVLPQVTASALSQIFLLFVGHYGWTLWYSCPINLNQWTPNMSPECMRNDVHEDPGIFGYWPGIDNHNGYWYQLSVQGLPVIGCVKGMFARVVLKPFMDFAMVLDGGLKEPEMPDFDKVFEQIDYWSHNETLLRAFHHAGGWRYTDSLVTDFKVLE